MAALIGAVAGAVLLDYLTGLLAAAREGNLSSVKGAKGLYKKLALFCALALGFFLDAAIPVLAARGFPDIDLPFRLIIAGWIVVNESISVTENLARCGVKLPGAVAKALKKNLSEPADKDE